MKKFLLVLLLGVIIVFNGLNLVKAQEQPKPKKDTVNMDTDAKPTFYYPVEDEKAGSKSGSGIGSSSVIIISASVIVVAGALGFFLIKKKK